jgi:hypothetical protein
MNQLHRLSVSVFFIAALSLAPAAQAVDITVADSSKVGSEISPGFGTTTDESVATEPSFPDSTSVGTTGLAAAADWSYVNEETSAVFSTDNMVATVSAAGSSAKNYVELVFTVGSELTYNITGGIAWAAQAGQLLTATLTLTREGDPETIVEVDETIPYLGFPINVDFADYSDDPFSGPMPADTYTLTFSVGVQAGLVSGTNSVSTNFSVVLDDSGGSSEPLIGGTPVDGLEDWYLSEWFGYYNTTFAPWLVHGEHGFIYRFPGSSNDNMFIYDDAMGCWWYTNETDYPYLYLFNPPPDTSDPAIDIEAEWVWYQEGSKSPRWFNVLTGPNAGSWLRFDP